MLRTICLFFLCAGVAASSNAFVVEGPRTLAETASLHLAQASRWASTEETFLETGTRGLGGGLEYAVDKSLCHMTFIDEADCESRKAAIQEALALWADGHPMLYFTDVSSDIEPRFPRRSSDDRLTGAEIDFFATNRRQFQPFSEPAVNGFTVFYDTELDGMRLTNGQMSTGPIGVIEGADIHFNRDACYYIDIEQKDEACVHFPSLVLHEMSHALGIGHPEDRAGLNLDTDDIPGNEIIINCKAPEEGLHVTPNYHRTAIAYGQNVQGPERWLHGLTWDDVAARDALYPHCDIERIERNS